MDSIRGDSLSHAAILETSALGRFFSPVYRAPEACDRSMITGVGRFLERRVPASLASLRKILSMLRPLALFIAIAALAQFALAQRGAGVAARDGISVHASLPHRGPGASFVSGGERGRDRFNRHAGPYSYLSLPFPFFDNAVDADDLYAAGYPIAAPLPPFMSAGAFSGYGGNSPRGVEDSPSSEPSQPLMIELQNGHYVQVSSSAIDGEPSPLNSGSSETRILRPGDTTAGPMLAPPAATGVVPVVLVFRDGHSEQVRDYTIANGTLYARGDYYINGYWNRQIDLASLNLPETMRANASRSVRFEVPSSPNEVIARF
jgi:hypothetical protein